MCKNQVKSGKQVSADDDAVLCLAGADASNDGKTVGSLGVITASTRIRTPQQAGQVLCQFRGKGDFREVRRSP